MNDLLETLAQLRSRIETLPEKKKLSNTLDGFQTRQDQFGAALARACEVVANANALREVDIGSDASAAAQIGQARELLIGLEARMAEEPSVALDFEFMPFYRQLDAAFGALIGHLRTQWIAYIRSEAPATSVADLTHLAQVPKLRSDINRILELQPVIDEAAGTLPACAEDLNTVLNCIEELNNTWNRLGEAVASPGMRAFLTQAGTGGAPLDALTQEVLEWLQENDLLLQFKVVSGAPPARD